MQRITSPICSTVLLCIPVLEAHLDLKESSQKLDKLSVSHNLSCKLQLQEGVPPSLYLIAESSIIFLWRVRCLQQELYKRYREQ